jgi:hypothetical protein
VRHTDLYFKSFDMVKWAPYQVPRPGGALLFLAFAYRQTGQAKYKDSIMETLTTGWMGPELGEQGGDGLFEDPRHPVLLDMQRKNKITCSIGDLMHLRPYGYTVMK